jgi:putative ABC transport system permease protein
MLYELLQLALTNMLRNRSRILMTISGVIVGTTAVMVLIAFTFGLQRAAETGVGASSMLTEVRVSGMYSPEDESVPILNNASADEMRLLEGVQAVIPIIGLRSSAELRTEDYVNYAGVIGIDAALLPQLNLQVEAGRLSLERGEVLFGGEINRYFADPEATEYEPIELDLFTEDIRLRLTSYSDNRQRDIPITPTGELQSGAGMYDGSLLMPLDDVLAYNEWVTGERVNKRNLVYDMFIVRTSGREATQAVAEVIRELGFYAEDAGQFLNDLNSFFSTMRLLLGGIGGVSLIVAAFGIANTMSMAILERTKEIGIMKAVGARDGDILTVFLVEAGLVGCVGGLIGVGLSYGLQNLVNQAVRSSAESGGSVPFMPFDFSRIGDQLLLIPPELPLLAIGLATGVGLIAGLLPAVRAARLLPVIALRQE